MKNEIERTFVLIKPDGVQRRLITEIAQRYHSKGLRIVEVMRVKKVSPELARKHYPDSLAKIISKRSTRMGEGVDGKYILGNLRKFLQSGPVVTVIMEGKNAIRKARTITGHTDPSRAEKRTIRGDLGQDSIQEADKAGRTVYNLVHASANPTEAKREIALWFGDEK